MAGFRQGLKGRACPWCYQIGFLILNGVLTGYGGSGPSDRQVRGQRIFCSNRWRKRGCGRTFSVLLSFLLKRCLIPSGLVAEFIARVLTGATRSCAWQSLAHCFSLESGYRVWRRWLRAQSHLRSWLCQKGPPPDNGDGAPTQTWAHLHVIFMDEPCPVSAFQAHFQQPFFPN